MWSYRKKVYERPTENVYGFVYSITNTVNNKQYIGKKLFWHKKTRIVKGRKKRYLAESDWQEYYGSSPALATDLELYGKDKFVKEILYLCKNKGECTYFEAKEQFKRDVLKKPDLYYNDWIICRVHRKHIN
jgi:sensor c-di-GMP phosphodiesterase-like protein